MDAILSPRRALDVRVGDLHCRLTRVDDLRWSRLRQNSLPIQEDTAFLLRFRMSESRAGRPWLSLAEVYAAFKSRFGEGSRCIDEWKSAFSFPFELEVFKGHAVYFYLLEVANWRSAFEFHFRKVLSSAETGFDRMVYHPPFEAEFSSDEMAILIGFLYGYVEEVSRGLRRTESLDDFIKQVPSSLTLFGARRGQFFVEQYDDEDELAAAFGDARRSIRDTRGDAGVRDVQTNDPVGLMWESEWETAPTVIALKRGLRRRMTERFGPLPAWAEVWVDQGGLTRFDGWMDRLDTATDLVSMLFEEDLERG